MGALDTADAAVHVRRWAPPLIVVALVLALIGVTGGFERSQANFGPVGALKQRIETRYWDFTVHRGGFTGTGEAMAVSLRVTLRSKLDESHVGITQEALMVRMPDGRTLGRSMCFQVQDREGNSLFHPFVETEAICTFGFDMNDYTYTGTGPAEVIVFVLDQTPSSTDFARTGEPEVLPKPAAHLPMTAEWLVQ